MFARPLLLLLLALLPLWWWRRRGRRPRVAFSDVAPLGPVRGSRRWLAEVPPALHGLAVGAWIIAAAGPQLSVSTTEIRSEGISIVLVVDVSSSMLAEDFAPSNRLDVAKEQAIAFVRGRQYDRIGLVAFAAEALTQVPLTTDYAVIEQAVLNLQIGQLEDGTAIGTALATGANRLRAAPEKSKVLVLLTDGESNRGRVDPRTAAEVAAELEIRIYTIGVGTEGEARLPIGRSPDGQVRYQMMPVRIDERLLSDVASATGGRYFRATDAEALGRIFQQIDQLEKSEVEVTRFAEYEEAYGPLVLAGLGALFVELILAATIVVRVP
ncbi:MAG TPA: VWA domain-containing protein [Gemmatimonadales bacterium]